MIDLQQFCAKEDLTKEYLRRPVSVGDYTYATNGHIMVRVPRRPEVEEAPANTPKKLDTPFPSPLPRAWRPVGTTPIPVDVMGPCDDCSGRGLMHACPSCQCACPTCDGSGLAPQPASCNIAEWVVDLRYARLIQALPGAEVATEPYEAGKPIVFRFAGGVGVVMPLTRRYPNHLDVVL